MRSGVSPTAANELRALKQSGVQRIPEIVDCDDFSTHEIRHCYLNAHIHFNIGERGKAAIERYRYLLVKHGLIADSGPVSFC